MIVAWFCFGLATGCVIGWFNGRAGYSNGFGDGARWMLNGDGYPSKPAPGWYGWDALRDERDRTIGL